VARLAPPDWNIEWFSYLGGSESDWAARVALDAGEAIHISGMTRSRDFPLRDPLSKRGDGSLDGFYSKVSPDGQVLVYSTLIGGEDEDLVLGMALGMDQLPVLVGATRSPDFLPLHSYQTGVSGATNQEAFAIKLALEPVRPSLEITRSGANLILSWPADADGFVLESSAGFGFGEWKVVPGAPLVLGSQKAVITRPAEAAQFYRLRRP
jgi:hypothetical protein